MRSACGGEKWRMNTGAAHLTASSRRHLAHNGRGSLFSPLIISQLFIYLSLSLIPMFIMSIFYDLKYKLYGLKGRENGLVHEKRFAPRPEIVLERAEGCVIIIVSISTIHAKLPYSPLWLMVYYCKSISLINLWFIIAKLYNQEERNMSSRPPGNEIEKAEGCIIIIVSISTTLAKLPYSALW